MTTRTLPLLCLVAVAVLGLALVSALGSAFAENQVNWQQLPGMSPRQMDQINALETQWRNIYGQYQPQIESDRTTLKNLIQTPSASEGQVMMIQNRIQKNEEVLRNEATRIFMKKKNVLTPEQKQKLQEQMGR